MRTGGGRLLASDAAAYGVDFQAGVLCSLDGAANGLADKGWNFDSSLFYIQNNGTAHGNFRGTLRVLLLWLDLIRWTRGTAGN